MSNWLDNYDANNAAENEIIISLEELKNKFPEEENTINNMISSLRNEFVNEEILFDMKEKLRRIITKDEHNLIRKKDYISKIIRRISELENEDSDSLKYDFEDCFFDDYDFKIGEGYYYLKFPKLFVKSEKNTKTEIMIDRYLKDFIKNSLSNYQIGRPEFEKFEAFTVIFIHYMTKENASNIDTDNIEIKKPIDAVNKVLIENDNAIYSDIFQIVVPSETEYTEMYILKGQSLGMSIMDLLKGLD